MAESSGPRTYSQTVDTVMKSILGDSGARAILFYTGEPNPETFEAKLSSILGDGAQMILQEIKRQDNARAGPSKHQSY
jgi:hypothetical protein